eukprot:TRINITY_DN9269_c0_g2_i1.p3 TRINITY_DN9269_c0_g2~~TRINITY_DN9269_c0_g2_i1.p3  ORF type:complete len:133 (+),score=52.05 TRINITY_DN9269_c0_g2_i1:52-450(+)
MPVVCPVTLAARVTHTVGGAALFASALGPYLFEGPLALKVNHHVFSALGVVVFAAGIFNAIKLAPAKMEGAAKTWRMTVYGGKLTCLALMTPLADLLFGEKGKAVKVGAGVSAFVMGAFARFYREYHMKRLE